MGLDRTNETTPPDSSSVLTSGSFRARDEMRRAEQAQLRKLKYSERLDRNIARAGRKGDSASVNSFLNIKRALNDGSMQTPGGISSYEDRQQRVKDGVIKGAEIRWEAGQVGKAKEDPIAGAPPVDSVTPKNRPTIEEAARVVPSENPNSIQRPLLQVPATQGGVQAPVVAPSAKTVQPSLKDRKALAADLDRSALVQSGDPKAMERAYARANDLGLSPAEVDNYVSERKAIASKSAEEKAMKAEVDKKAYDTAYGESDTYVNQAIDNLDPAKFTPAQIAQIRANTKKISAKDRKDATKEGKDASSWNAFDAKRRVAEKAGLNPDDVNPSTNFGEEAKALIPGAKRQLQNVIDAADLMGNSKLSNDLKARRGAPAFSEDQARIVAEGSDITNRGGAPLDPIIPSGNPLFDNPNGASNAWNNSKASKRPVAKKTKTGSENLNVRFEDRPWYDKRADELISTPEFLKGTAAGWAIDKLHNAAKRGAAQRDAKQAARDDLTASLINYSKPSANAFPV